MDFVSVEDDRSYLGVVRLAAHFVVKNRLLPLDHSWLLCHGLLILGKS